jgi:hypothetical protein
MKSSRALPFVLLFALAGCTTNSGAGLVRPNLPVLPGNLSTPCKDPGVRAGQPVLIELGRNRAALIECKNKHRDIVSFTDRLRAAFSGK